MHKWFISEVSPFELPMCSEANDLDDEAAIEFIEKIKEERRGFGKLCEVEESEESGE